MTLYNSIGTGYSRHRRPDHRIASAIDTALGDATSVVNVGAGTGSYEPSDRDVVAVEPSEVMIRQRPQGAAPCLQGSAEALPLETNAVDASMAILTTHHWSDPERGYREMARVARQRVVLLTWVPGATRFWLTQEYFPEIGAHDHAIFPDSATLVATLERIIGPVRMSPVLIPHDCTDGFLCAYWRRPECYLDAQVRGAISSFARIDAQAGLERLRADISSGQWGERHAHLLSQDAMDYGYRVFCCEIDTGSRADPTPHEREQA
ncbi:MAG: class I SAM-dependent methyltransferase [Phycisphaerales bacterium JB043]